MAYNKYFFLYMRIIRWFQLFWVLFHSCQLTAKKLPLTHTFCSRDGEQKFKKSLYSLALHSTLSLCSDTQLRLVIINTQSTYNVNEKYFKLPLLEAVHTLPLQKAHGYRKLCNLCNNVTLTLGLRNRKS